MATYQLKLRERRMSERKRLTGLMPGRFLVNGKDITVKPFDISEHGIGVMIQYEIVSGTKATMMLGDRAVPFEFKWGEPDFGKHDMWRYGLVCLDQNINMEVEFAEFGCLK